MPSLPVLYELLFLQDFLSSCLLWKYYCAIISKQWISLEILLLLLDGTHKQKSVLLKPFKYLELLANINQTKNNLITAMPGLLCLGLNSLIICFIHSSEQPPLSKITFVQDYYLFVLFINRRAIRYFPTFLSWQSLLAIVSIPGADLLGFLINLKYGLFGSTIKDDLETSDSAKYCHAWQLMGTSGAGAWHGNLHNLHHVMWLWENLEGTSATPETPKKL